MNSIDRRFYWLLVTTWVIFGGACRTVTVSEHNHVHDLYSLYGEMIPCAIPDQIILNLTEDPLTSVAVNWRTDLNVLEGEVRISKATHGPELVDQYRVIKASTSTFHNQFAPEPEINCHYHSAIIDSLQAGEEYVYQVGFDTIWSEWFQFRMPNDEKLSLIYFGDAQNDVKSLWSRVIRQAYAKFPQVDFMLHAGDLINRFERDLEWAE